MKRKFRRFNETEKPKYEIQKNNQRNIFINLNVK